MHDGIRNQITRIRNLVQRLVVKLRTMNLLSGSDHDFEDAVAACENINTSGVDQNLIQTTVYINNIVPVSPITIPTGYVGHSSVTILPDSNYISPDKIVQNHSILGIQGTALNAYEPRRLSWDTNASNSNTISVNSNSILPKFEELFLFRKADGCTYEYPEMIYCFYNKVNDNFTGLYLNKSSGTAQPFHMGNGGLTYEYTNNGKSLTITVVASSNVKFNGHYVLYYYY